MCNSKENYPEEISANPENMLYVDRLDSDILKAISIVSEEILQELEEETYTETYTETETYTYQKIETSSETHTCTDLGLENEVESND